MGVVLTLKGANFSDSKIATVKNLPIDFSGVDRYVGVFGNPSGSPKKGSVFVTTNPEYKAQATAAGMNAVADDRYTWCIIGRYTATSIEIPEGASAIGGLFNVSTRTATYIPEFYTPAYFYADKESPTVIETKPISGDIRANGDLSIVDSVGSWGSNNNYRTSLVKGILRIPDGARAVKFNWILPYGKDDSLLIPNSLVPVGLNAPRLYWIVEN